MRFELKCNNSVLVGVLLLYNIGVLHDAKSKPAVFFILARFCCLAKRGRRWGGWELCGQQLSCSLLAAC